jgi:hypothetical protein
MVDATLSKKALMGGMIGNHSGSIIKGQNEDDGNPRE